MNKLKDLAPVVCTIYYASPKPRPGMKNLVRLVLLSADYHYIKLLRLSMICSKSGAPITF